MEALLACLNLYVKWFFFHCNALRYKFKCRPKPTLGLKLSREQKRN